MQADFLVLGASLNIIEGKSLEHTISLLQVGLYRVLDARFFQSALRNKHLYHGPLFVCLFVCYVALHPKSTAMVMAGRSVHQTTLFPGQA